MISMDQLDLATYRPTMNPPHNLTGSIPEPPAATPRGFRHQEKLLGLGPRKVAALKACHDKIGP
jgi:hypothetical protein